MLQSIDKKNKVIIYILFFILISSINNKNYLDTRNLKDNIIKIDVFGLSNMKNLEILKRLNEIPLGNIIFLKKNLIKNLMLEYNLVESFTVKRLYPSSIQVFIKPTKFLARTKNDNRSYIIGSNGKLIKEKNVNKSLPFLYGKFDDKNFLEFYKLLNNSEFEYKDIKSIFFFSSKRWDIELIDNLLIKLPIEKVSESLKLAFIIKNHQEHKDIKIIDLRIANRIILK